MSVAGTLTFESDQPFVIKELLPEGCGAKKFTISDEWDFKSAGGCGNFGTFDKNPVFVLNLIADETEIQVRLAVLAECSPDGSTLINDSDKFTYCVNAAVYRVPANRYPPPSGSIDVKSLTNPALNTYGGKYTNNLSAIITEKVMSIIHKTL